MCIAKAAPLQHATTKATAQGPHVLAAPEPPWYSTACGKKTTQLQHFGTQEYQLEINSGIAASAAVHTLAILILVDKWLQACSPCSQLNFHGSCNRAAH